MLQQIGPDIWVMDGPQVIAAAGFHYPTRMTILKLRKGDLVLISPTAFSPETLSLVSALGPIMHLVAPNALHHLAIGDWMAACPNAKSYAAPRLQAKRKDLTFSVELRDASPWPEEIDTVVMAPHLITDEVVFFHRASGTAVFTDLIQQLPQGWYRGMRAIIAKLDLMQSDPPTVPRKFRMGFRNRRALAAQVARLNGWPVQRLIMAHGSIVQKGAADVLRHAFGWVKP